MSDPITKWHEIVATQDTSKLPELLADDVVFHSPVVHTAQQGKAITLKYLEAALKVLLNDTWRYVREIVDENNAALEFAVELDGIAVNGVDLITWNADQKIIDFKVMIRPLKAIAIVRERMANELQPQT